jgi:hypothetical protein
MKLRDIKDHLLTALGNPSLVRPAIAHLRQIQRRRKLARSTPALVLPPEQSPRAADVVATLASQIGVLRLGHHAARQWIGVADLTYGAALDAILAAWPGAWLSSLGGGQPIGSAAARKAGAACIISTSGERIELERFDLRIAGHWVSVNAQNVVARALYDDRLARGGLHEIAHLLGGQTFAQKSEAEAVDLVFTWVNHEDAGWQKLFADHAPKQAGITDAAALTRFVHNDDLLYSLRSVARNLPWVRQIYVVSNCARPEWLADHPAITWLDHSAILPPEALPTFNSHAIETCLHRIPGLAEQFIYMNDDIFISRPLQKADFFAPNGASLVFLEAYATVCGEIAPGAPDYLNASRVAARLLLEVYGVVPARLHAHAPYALKRSILSEIEHHFATEMKQTRANKFRGLGDVNMTSFLYHHAALALGKAQEAKAQILYVGSADPRWRAQINGFRRETYEFICLNEGGMALPARDWSRVKKRFLSGRFPFPAPWEKA